MEYFTANERYLIIKPVLEQTVSVTEAAQQARVSRQLLHKWLARYHDGGISNLATRSSAPRTTPHAVDEAVVVQLVALRSQHPTWGAKKLKAWLEQRYPRQRWPAASTIGDVLRRRGLVRQKRRRRGRSDGPRRAFQPASKPNDTWCMDFKGHFQLGRGGRCHPLTVQDLVSRYLLVAEAMPSERDELVWPALERGFREYGLPNTVRHDNGGPFAGPGPAGLSRLSVRLIKLGITVERTDVASPAQNGRLERMHRVMKAETASPPQATMVAQQRALDRFRDEYNDERPHEALDMQPPAALYRPSRRAYPDQLPEIEYGHGVEPRRLYPKGIFKWKGFQIFVGAALGGELVGLRAIGDGLHEMLFRDVFLGVLDESHLERGLIRHRSR